VYRSVNAANVVRLTNEAIGHGWQIRLWALDRIVPELATYTVGAGPGQKFPLVNQLLDGPDGDVVEWMVVADDDFVFVDGSLGDLLALGDLAGLDLFQPAHTEMSYCELALPRRVGLAVARQTTFVEIGPVFAVRRPWAARIVPFPSGHTMGWGLELEWMDLVDDGAVLGIVDAVPIRHLSPVGRSYAWREQLERLNELLRARGLDSIDEAQRTIAVWRPWQHRPPWVHQ
jgi:hypothetical protein